jgi:selenocysteine lyase/cysteine desulfurase
MKYIKNYFGVHKRLSPVFSGILIAKKSLFKNTAPNGCGGGTVFFVTRESHRYLQDTELREEGGTAAVVESVRAGLVMQLKETIGVQAIMAREEKISRLGFPFFCGQIIFHLNP